MNIGGKMEEHKPGAAVEWITLKDAVCRLKQAGHPAGIRTLRRWIKAGKIHWTRDAGGYRIVVTWPLIAKGPRLVTQIGPCYVTMQQYAKLRQTQTVAPD